MAKGLNFNTLKKTYLPVTLKDDSIPTLLITTPTKKDMDLLVEMNNKLQDASIDQEVGGIDELYDICAKLMSRNIGNVTVTTEQLEECMDVEDIIIFLTTYTAFINEVTGLKN